MVRGIRLGAAAVVLACSAHALACRRCVLLRPARVDSCAMAQQKRNGGKHVRPKRTWLEMKGLEL